MKEIRIEWNGGLWVAPLPDGTREADQHLPSLIVALAGGDKEKARKIEIIF